MPVKSKAPSNAPDLDADFARLVSTMDCQILRSLASGGPHPEAMVQANQRGELNKRHLPALLAIALAGSISVTDLAVRLGLGLPTTSTLVGELSRAGLIERSESPTDRRRTIVRVDDDHSEAITAWAREALTPLRRTLERLSSADRAGFVEGWMILNQETAARG